MAGTPRFSLPYILSNQAQKEVTHNEALNDLDVWLQAVAQSADAPAPPVSPQEGEAWIVPAGGTGAWAGRDGRLAQWIGEAWTFHDPVPGAVVWIADRALWARYDETSGWVVGDITAMRVLVDGQPVLGARRPAIADPTGGAVVDAEARAAIAEMLATLRQHGLIES